MPASPANIAAALKQALPLTGDNRLYGVVDAAQCVDLAYEAKILYGREIRSLFLPEVQTQLWDVAPYLVPIDPDSGYLENWARRWGTNAGVLLTSAADEEALHAHLRNIFVAQDEEGQEYFFRFYDPRVLRTFLPTCSPEQLNELFGPISLLGFDRDGKATLELACCTDGSLRMRSIDLGGRAVAVAP